jgi:hypothetical protein
MATPPKDEIGGVENIGSVGKTPSGDVIIAGVFLDFLIEFFLLGLNPPVPIDIASTVRVNVAWKRKTEVGSPNLKPESSQIPSNESPKSREVLVGFRHL